MFDSVIYNYSECILQPDADIISTASEVPLHFGAVTRISRSVKLLYREELLGTTNPSVSTDRPKECDACSVAGLQCKPVRDDVRTQGYKGTLCANTG